MGPSQALTTQKIIDMLNDPENKDPAKLGNVASNLFDSMDKETVDVDKVRTTSYSLEPPC